MLGVVIPAHNEEVLIGGCLRSIIRASLHPALVGEDVRIFVVVDSCSDETAAIARALGAQVLSVEERNVGAARATGAAAALSQRARWLSFTDADGHRHIHGANLGVAATAYRLVNGFQPHIFNEDVALVEALIAAGATIAWSAAPRVVTSARLECRAPGGFGAALCSANRRLERVAMSETADEAFDVSEPVLARIQEDSNICWPEPPGVV